MCRFRTGPRQSIHSDLHLLHHPHITKVYTSLSSMLYLLSIALLSNLMVQSTHNSIISPPNMTIIM